MGDSKLCLKAQYITIELQRFFLVVHQHASDHNAHRLSLLSPFCDVRMDGAIRPKRDGLVRTEGNGACFATAIQSELTPHPPTSPNASTRLGVTSSRQTK
jgi:hypothetical protein